MAKALKKALHAKTPRPTLGGVEFEGFAHVAECAPVGMILLRAKFDVAGLADAVKMAVGVDLPTRGQILQNKGQGAAWMSPDEYLLILAYNDVSTTLAAFNKALAGSHILAIDVSDARAVFDVTGLKAAQVLTKLCPVDLSNFDKGHIRRTRAAQVAVAFWREGMGFRLVCFRSVAGYVMGLLTHSAQEGSELA
ncbi:MAG: sarcosine oxidase subunit gamma family protein [Paracoccaceae bacterium]|jgi:sarcosine oxidase subunit gamma